MPGGAGGSCPVPGQPVERSRSCNSWRWCSGCWSRLREAAAHLRRQYQHRARRYAARSEAADDGRHEEDAEAVRRARRELLRAERQAVLALRDRVAINDEVLRRVERDLDLEELR
jgi:hypothetical protein